MPASDLTCTATFTRNYGALTLVSTTLGYALQTGTGTLLQITYSGQYASAGNPGGGWSAIGAVAVGTGYTLYWKNTNGTYAQWNLNGTGASTGGRALSGADLYGVEDVLGSDLTGDGKVGLAATFVASKTIGAVTLGSTTLGYALQTGTGTLLQITYSGQYASASNPGGGWSAIGAVAAGTGYTLYWKNTNGTYAQWNLNGTGASTGGRALSGADLYGVEDVLGSDLTGDGQVGLAATFVASKTIGAVTLGSTTLGYALQVGGANTPLQVTASGQYASAGNPGGGWSAIGAAAAGTGYTLYWKNTNGTYAQWTLDGTGALTGGRALSGADLYGVEDALGSDLTGDGKVGLAATFVASKTIGAVTLGSTTLGYALKTGTGNPLQITYGGQYTSAGNPGGGWSAIGAAAAGTGYTLYWKNTNGTYAQWTLDGTGAPTGGRALVGADLYGVEDVLGSDLTGDGKVGLAATFVASKTIGAVTLGRTTLGYALQVGGANTPLQITYNGQYASAGSPGGGWSAIGAAAAGTGYTLYWKNTNGTYAQWTLDGTGASTGGRVLSGAEMDAAEVALGTDLTGDGA
jgi:diketogulonate reductase-like aldo/keto reductase